MITIYIPKVLRRYSDNTAEHTLSGATIGQALEDLLQRFPLLRERLFDKHGHIWSYLVLFHNDQNVPREAFANIPLNPGDHLELVGAAVGGSSKNDGDVRMRGFASRHSVPEACALAWGQARPLAPETIDISEAPGRILAQDIVSNYDIPSFRRSAMDGYALRAEDTFSASPYDPLPLTLLGQSLPGRPFTQCLGPGQAIRIMTGAPLPEGADAVLKAEDSKLQEPGQVLACAAVSPGKNVGRIGEDITRGQALLSSGRCLRPQDLGALASIGQTKIKVWRRPQIRIIATGDELLAPGATPNQYNIVDSNSPMLAALIARDGGVVQEIRRLPDNPDLIRMALSDPGPDVIIASGGSSVGQEDWLPSLLRELGELPIHGITIRPSAPTGIGSIAKRPVLLLPGNPVSCLCAYDFFAGPLIRALGGRSTDWPYPRQRYVLAHRISSQIGRTDYLRVRLNNAGLIEPIAIAGASALSSTVKADGFVIVPEISEGLPEGAEVEVFLYDLWPPHPQRAESQP